MNEVNYPTAYTMYEVKKYIGHSMNGLPIVDTECFVVMACYVTKHTIKYDYDGKIHEEYEVIFMRKQNKYDDSFTEVEDVLFEEPQVVSFISGDYATIAAECNKENKKLLIKQYDKTSYKDMKDTRESFYQRQEILQDRADGRDKSLLKSRKDYNE